MGGGGQKNGKSSDVVYGRPLVFYFSLDEFYVWNFVAYFVFYGTNEVSYFN